MRIGAKKRPFYRVVVIDERSKRSGEYIELLGTYNPLTNPHEVNLKQDRIDHWTKQGAQMSDGYLRIIGKAPQRPARKPKKEKKEEAPAAAPTKEKPAETPAETPVEEAKLETDETNEEAEGSVNKGEKTSPSELPNERLASSKAEQGDVERTDEDETSEPTPETEPTPEVEEQK